MPDKPQATVHVLHPTSTLPAKRKAKKHPYNLKQLLDAGTPLIDAGLKALARTSRGAPYAAALRLLADAGQEYLANGELRAAVDKIKKLRKQIVVLDKDDIKRVVLQEKLDRELDKL